MDGYSKFQYSQFDKLEGQYVVRTDDPEEFKKLVAQVKIATGNTFPQASQTSKSASTDEKPKVPYLHEGDACPTCKKGILQKTVKESKSGEKYNALVCDQSGCKGFAYLSKFPKTTPTIPDREINEGDLPF